MSKQKPRSSKPSPSANTTAQRPRLRRRPASNGQNDAARPRKRIRRRPEPEATADKDYEVGFGKPPKASQFKPGQTGNKKGRPKRSRNFKTELREEVNELISITEGGNTRKIPKIRAYIKRMSELALKGDPRAAKIVLDWVQQYLAVEEAEHQTKGLSEEDNAIIENLLGRKSKSFNWKEPDTSEEGEDE